MRGLPEWEASDDARIEGLELPGARELFFEGLRLGVLELLLIVHGERIVGYDIVSALDGWLEGHQTWIAPEDRGRGFWRCYVEEAARLADERGLAGFTFTSTLPFWRTAAPGLGFRVTKSYNQRNGPFAYRYERSTSMMRPEGVA